MLRTICKSSKGKSLSAVDYMDDGTAIQLKVTIDETTGGAVFDFEGTEAEAYGKYLQYNPLKVSNFTSLD